MLMGPSSSDLSICNMAGNVVVGGSFDGTFPEAFRRVEGVGLRGLGALPGGSFSEAEGVNTDGSIVVGESSGSSGERRAFIWRATPGSGGGSTVGSTGGGSGGTIEDMVNLPASFPVLGNDT